MKKLSTVLICFALPMVVFCQTVSTISFNDVGVTSALKAVGRRMGANIVFYGKEIPKVSLDVSITSTEQAVQAVAAASGLIYRKVDDVYVVAAPDSMRQALEPYGVRTEFELEPGQADTFAPKIQEAFPYATIHKIGDKIIFVAPMSDVPDARKFIDDLKTNDQMVTEVVSSESMNGKDVASVVSTQFPDLKVSSSDAQGAPVSISGTAPMVARAKDMVAKMLQDYGNDVFKIYTLKYASAPKVMDFLKDAAKDVQAFIAPPAYSPERATFSPLGSAISSAIGTSSASNNGYSYNYNYSNGTSVGQVPTADDYTKTNRPHAIVLRGWESRVDAAIKMLEAIDIKPKQVSVEVSVVETAPSLVSNEGFQWSWAPLQFFEQGYGGSTTSTATRPMGLGSFSRAPLSFTSVLNAQIQKGDAKVLAKPNVVVADDNDASIFVGDTVRAAVSAAGALGTETVQIQEFPVGIILLLHPRVNNDGNITLHVNPVVSTITSIGQDNIPQTSSREAETTVVLKDGETVVLGGLIRDEYSKVVTEVPFLSQIPIIGELFRNRSINHKRTDVIVTITIHMIPDTTDANK